MSATPIPTTAQASPPRPLGRRSIPELLAPLERIATRSTSLLANHGARFESNGDTYELPRYLFIGPKGGDEPIRIGLFAGIHGDEPEGVHALMQFVELARARAGTRGRLLLVSLSDL